MGINPGRGLKFEAAGFNIQGLFAASEFVRKYVLVGLVVTGTERKMVNPKYPDPSKVPILRTRTPAIQVQTPPLEGPWGSLGKV